MAEVTYKLEIYVLFYNLFLCQRDSVNFSFLSDFPRPHLSKKKLATKKVRDRYNLILLPLSVA